MQVRKFPFLFSSAYVGTYNEMKGIISPSNAFKTAARDAFNSIASFTNIVFEEVTESGSVVGDFRIGITDKDHFAMESVCRIFTRCWK